MIYFYFALLIISFAVLFKCAGYFVDGSCAIAKLLNIPKMVIGIVLVGLATTVPELCVSVQASYLGHPEIALGNAIGSVICDDGIALAMAAILAPTAIFVNCRILKIVGVFLLSIDFLAYFLARNGTVGRLEGGALVLILCLYYIFVLRSKDFKVDKYHNDNGVLGDPPEKLSVSRKSLLKRPLLFFMGGIIGVIFTSRLIIWASIRIAQHYSISETIIGLTVIAIGTSLPEISTCITAGLKGEGEIAVGNIIGADILNVLWIIGVSSIVHPITVELEVINFSFPYMILIVTVMLASMRFGCRVGKIKGILLFILYVLYFFLTLKLFV